VATLAVATVVFSLGTAEVSQIAAPWIGNLINLKDANEIAQLKQTIANNFNLLQTMLLAVIFYLTVNLYHHTTTVLRLYAYLGKIETEIRSHLKLAANDVSFTRESSFYYGHRSLWLSWVGKIYVLILLVLLGSFFYLRLLRSWQTGWDWFMVADLIIAVAIAAYFYAYSTASIKS
jgi:hypothetical protein